MFYLFIEVRLNVTEKDGERIGTSILDWDYPSLNLKKGQVLAYSKGDKYKLMANTREFFKTYLSKELDNIRFGYTLSEEYLLYTREIKYSGSDLWGCNIKLGKDESPYD